MSDGRRVVEPKRVKVTGSNDNWTGYVVCVDGRPLEVVSVALSVECDKVNTVTLVLEASAVQFDINTSDEVEYFIRDIGA